MTEDAVCLAVLSDVHGNLPALQTVSDNVRQYGVDGIETQGVETYHTGNRYVAFRDPDHIQLEYWLPK